MTLICLLDLYIINGMFEIAPRVKDKALQSVEEVFARSTCVFQTQKLTANNLKGLAMKVDLIDLLDSIIEGETDPLRMEVLTTMKTQLEDMEETIKDCLTLFDFYARSHKAKHDALGVAGAETEDGIDRWNKYVTNQSMLKIIDEKHGIDFDAIENDEDLLAFRSELFALADFSTDHLDKKED